MARVAILGAGTMGHALALVFALGGHQVRLTDSNPATLERAQGLMETALATLAKYGEVPAERDAAWRASCEHSVRPQLPFLCETQSREPGFLETFGKDMIDFFNTQATLPSLRRILDLLDTRTTLSIFSAPGLAFLQLSLRSRFCLI